MPAYGATSVAAIQARHVLRCGIDQSEAEYSMDDLHGPRVAFDRDVCRAVAIALLGPGAKVEEAGFPDAATALRALERDEVDVVASVSESLAERAGHPGLQFSRTLLHDELSVMMLRGKAPAHVAGLRGKKLCLLAETPAETRLRDWFGRRHLDFVPFPFQEQGEMEAAFVTGNCAGMAGLQTRLVDARAAFGPQAGRYALAPEELADDPLAAATGGDTGLALVVDAVIDGLLLTEEAGLTAATIAAEGTQTRGEFIDRLTGRTHETGRLLGLRDDWLVDAVRAVGNYGEMFRRDLDVPLGLTRGANRLWRDGGWMRGRE